MKFGFQLNFVLLIAIIHEGCTGRIDVEDGGNLETAERRGSGNN